MAGPAWIAPYLPYFPTSLLFPPPTLVLPALSPLHFLHSGPACHCGRSRLAPPPFISFPYPHYPHIYHTFHTYLSLLLHLFWPGLSLWQVPPTSPTFLHLLPLYPPDITLPLIHPPFSYTVARLVIVAGPAISSCPCTFLSPLSPALPPVDICLQAPSTSSPI